MNKFSKLTLISFAGFFVSIFYISTYETDYLLVKEENLEKAIKILGAFCNIER